jgi:predicted DNA-binding transcriptional regulator
MLHLSYQFYFNCFSLFIVISGTIAYVATEKKKPSDNFNSKISNNLSQYEKEMKDRYKL